MHLSRKRQRIARAQCQRQISIHSPQAGRLSVYSQVFNRGRYKCTAHRQDGFHYIQIQDKACYHLFSASAHDPLYWLIHVFNFRMAVIDRKLQFCLLQFFTFHPNCTLSQTMEVYVIPSIQEFLFYFDSLGQNHCMKKICSRCSSNTCKNSTHQITRLSSGFIKSMSKGT